MIEVRYIGVRSMVNHRGAFRYGRHNDIPYVFTKGEWVPIQDKDDIAMFQGMAKKGPNLWEVRETGLKVAEQAVKKIAKAVTGRKQED